jgi:hypothetical protein
MKTAQGTGIVKFATNSQNWQQKMEKQGKYNDFILLYRTAKRIKVKSGGTKGKTEADKAETPPIRTALMSELKGQS